MRFLFAALAAVSLAGAIAFGIFIVSIGFVHRGIGLPLGILLGVCLASALALIRIGRTPELLKRVRRLRPGSFACLVDPTPGQQELERLTEHSGDLPRMVISSEATGLAFWTADQDEPLAEIPWSSIEGTDLGSAAGAVYSNRTLIFKLTGGGTLEFLMVGHRLPLDVLNDMLVKRDRPRMLED